MCHEKEDDLKRLQDSLEGAYEESAGIGREAVKPITNERA